LNLSWSGLAATGSANVATADAVATVPTSAASSSLARILLIVIPPSPAEAHEAGRSR